MPITETVWVGHDNAVRWQLLEHGAPLGAERAQPIDRVVLDLGTLSVDSAVEPEVLSVSDDVVTLKLGRLAGLSALADQRVGARLVVYSSDALNGVVWTDTATLMIRGPRA